MNHSNLISNYVSSKIAGRRGAAGEATLGLEIMSSFARMISFHVTRELGEVGRMAEQMNVSLRNELGTRECRRLRRGGQVPAILYGHGEANLNLSVPKGEVLTAIRHGSQMLEMRGAVSETALIREVQWDAFGIDVLHIDLTRVSAEEAVEVTISVELRGEAPGTKEGGVVEHQTHQVQILCPAGSIPEKLAISINDLHLSQTITADVLDLPDGASLLTPGETIIATCVEPVSIDDDDDTLMDGIEPEVIGRKEEEGTEES